jgi:hypothetical protein
VQEILSVSKLTANVADPGSGTFCPLDQDGKTQIHDQGSGMNIPDLIFRT